MDWHIARSDDSDFYGATVDCTYTNSDTMVNYNLLTYAAG